MQGYPAKDRQAGQVTIKGLFTINGTSDPDGVTISGVTVTRSAEGVFKVAISNAGGGGNFCQFDYYSASYKAGVATAAGDATWAAYVEDAVVPSGTDDGYIMIATYSVDAGGLLVASEVDNAKVAFEIVIRQFASPDS